MTQDVQLTDRERQVLALRATGKTVPEVAAALSVAERTANFHLANIYAKLGLEHLTPGERQLRLAERAHRLTAHVPSDAATDAHSKGTEPPTPPPLPLSPAVEVKHPVITFRVTRLPDGRVCAENRVHHSYRDELSGLLVEGTYSGKMIGDDKDMAPGPVLEHRLRRSVTSEFGLLPRPLTVRVVYEGEGLEPAGPGETSFVVSDYLPET